VRSGVPNFELAVEGGPENQVREAMLKGNADLVILAENGSFPDRMRAWPLFRENFRLIMSTSHPLAAKATLALQDLDGQDVIERVRCKGCQRLRQLCAASGVMPRFRHRVDNVEQLLNLVRAGFGVGFTMRSSRLIEGLVGRPIDRVEVTREVSLATVAGRPFSAATDAFVKLARMRDWTEDLAATDLTATEA
jgi:DNA-binding transcriptional LysR family regulator